ncbi:hypothetical protein [Pseudomonas amygdali]|uniref:hypothetical protein n=1 Tax=Pseudomonas amygdali TaxID=47877 RepID=UPI000AACDAF6|nr:hypothetical protein [Pseudomonas amygdali]
MHSERGAHQDNLPQFGVALPSLGGFAKHSACGAFVVPDSLKLPFGSLAEAEIEPHHFASKAESSLIALGFWADAQPVEESGKLEVSKLKCDDCSLYGPVLYPPPRICELGHRHTGFPVEAEGGSGNESVTVDRLEGLIVTRRDSELPPIVCFQA